MKPICHHIQEKIACELDFDLSDHKHLAECIACQRILYDYQLMASLLTEQIFNLDAPDNFVNRVMQKIESTPQQDDWYGRLMYLANKTLHKPLVQYGSMAAGFGLGMITFVRFVAFVFTPA